MNCNFKVECVIPSEITKDKIQEIVCSKIANVIISQEKEICTLVNSNQN